MLSKGESSRGSARNDPCRQVGGTTGHYSRHTIDLSVLMQLCRLNVLINAMLGRFQCNTSRLTDEIKNYKVGWHMKALIYSLIWG
jgi:hypothetical protein